MDIEGAVVPLVTPSTGGNDVDVETLHALTVHLVDGGVHGLFPCGTTGEFSSLSRTMRKTVVETVVDAADGTPVYAGCGATSVEAVRTLVSDAADAGADAAVVVTPFYLESDDDGLLKFYRQIAEDAPLPIVLYDIPGLTGHRLSPKLVGRLAADERIVGIKDSSGDIAHVERLGRVTPENFAVLQGSTANAHASLDAGVDGFVAGGANAVPSRYAAAYEAHQAGKLERSRRLVYDDIFPIVGALTSLPTVPATKYLATVAGVDVGDPFPPLSPLTGRERSALEERVASVVESVD
ncbi:dihydrodipicolinate synthase family protein [Halomontanus rarus]|uniref:dihydrodipicolinate synthase family protein n=1 Tax=Halomontanus rarus TaxID=3034020 RepID=UPI00293BA135|nr:dihydrodipicolinate synthase family protein [Halovivax sp. KZCA124]